MWRPELLVLVAGAALFLRAGPAPALSQTKDPWVGRRVITKDGSVLKVGERVIDDGRRRLNPTRTHDKAVHRVYRVVQTNGNWLWLVPEKGGPSGWVLTDSVLPVDRAIRHFTDEIRDHPDKPIHYVNRGMIWLETGEYDIAIADFNEAVRLDPKSDIPYQDRGRAWSLKQQYDKAIADFNEAVRIDPHDALSYKNRGTAWRDKREYDKAITDFNEALRLQPGDAEAYVNRGWAWAAKKEYGKALADFNEAIRLDPVDGFYFNNRAWFSATCPDPNYRDGKRAVVSATHACELSGWKDAFNLGTLAAACAEAGDFAAAVKWQEQAQGFYADDKDRQEGLARLGQYKQKRPYRLATNER